MASSPSDTPRTIVLLGETSTGKSSAGNTILGKQAFATRGAAAECTGGHGVVNGRAITIIDTPGFFDTDGDDAETKSVIIRFLKERPSGVDAYVFILKVKRYTKWDVEAMEELLSEFEETVLKHAVILFTFGDQLEDQTLEEFMKGNSQLQQLVEKFQGRHHVIDSRYWNDRQSGSKSNSVQVKNLLETIDKMVLENGCYTKELFRRFDQNQNGGILRRFSQICNTVIQLMGAKKGALCVALLGIGVAFGSGLIIKLFLLNKYHK